MLWPYAGFDPTERQITPRGPASRFSDEQIAEMVAMAGDGCSGVEIAHALGVKAQSVRAKLANMGIKLRRAALRSRIRMVIGISKRMRLAANARGLTIQQLIRRLMQTISRDNLFDTILPLPMPRSLGAAATNEPPPRRHNQPPTILRRIELAGCVGDVTVYGLPRTSAFVNGNVASH